MLHNHVFRLLASMVAVAICATSVYAGARDSRATAKRAFKQLQARYGTADALWRDGQAGPHIVTGLTVKPHGDSLRENARAFLRQNAALVGVAATSLRHIETSKSKHRVVARYQQTWAGRDVLDRIVAVRMEQDGTVLGLVSDAMPVRSVPKATVPASNARHIAATAVNAPVHIARQLHAKAMILAHPSGAWPVWQVHVAAVPLRAHYRVVVDATNGKVVSIHNLVQH